jgi:malonyl CoA-acyl carrier protein transacylase/NAD(P)-dependent dehydrogenase (short-subunit alcohol dehydrogenase family)
MRYLLAKHPEFEALAYPQAAFTATEKQAQTQALTDTRAAQPLLGIVDLAIAELLRHFGIEADFVAGHSYGELPALCYAGAFDRNDLCALSAKRAEAILAALGEDAGRMVAVLAESEKVTSLLADANDLWAVNLNAPKQTVVAGTSQAIETLIAKLKKEKVKHSELKVAGAFHSPLLANAEKDYISTLADYKIKKPKIPVWSNTSAEVYPATAATIKKRLGEHLVKPVRFVEEVEAMYEAGARIFIEAGPGGVLTGLVGRILKGRDYRAIQTEQANSEGLTYLLNALAQYLACGKTLEFEKLFAGRTTQIIDFDSPETYKKNGTVWNVDGLKAKPETGELPAHAGKVSNSPIMSLDQLKTTYAGASAESIMMVYLDNMNALIQDQRDVMLGYLGQPDMIPRTAAPARQIIVGNSQPALSGQTQEPEVVEAQTLAEANDADERPSILTLNSEQINTLVLEIVSEKTGYPIDMLGLDVDLESELSIDSIKKMEIIGALRDRTVFPDDAEDMEESFERLIAIKSIREMITWIEELESTAPGDGSEATDTFKGSQAVIESGVAPASSEADQSIIRMSILESALPLGELDNTALEGKLFAITDDGLGFAQNLQTELVKRKAEAQLVNAATKDLSNFDGLILINAVASKSHVSIVDLFNLIKRADQDKLQWIYIFDDVPGALLRSRKLSKVKLLEGFPGFIKTLRHEFPDKRLRAVSFQTAFDQESFAVIAADELASIDRHPEIFYRGEERLTYLPAIQALTQREDGAEPIELTKDSKVIVFGGGQGITPVLLTHLAQQYPCHYLLVGRSEVVQTDEAYRELGDRNQIRKHLIEVEGLKQAKEIEAKVNTIFKANQIAASLKLIEDAGATATYHSVDVTDTKALKSFINTIREEHGRIDGLIHAAGILEDKLFRDKDVESFKRVYDTKVSPLPVVLSELYDDLKLFVMFSSMSSAFGNVGQCDYAAGNSVFDIVAQILGQKKPELRVVAFNWGPWKGAGMVNAGLEDEFRKRGIAFLQLDSGGEFFTREILQGTESNILAIAGNEQELQTLIDSALQ